MTASASPTRGVFLSRVLANDPICREHWRCVLAIDDFPPAKPGQFVQILCREPQDGASSPDVFLRRPFSIGGLRRRSGHVELDILHRVVGPGTRWLSRRSSGDAVDVLGPLGRPFTPPRDRSTAMLVGGGIGLPPLIWLARTLRDAGVRATALIGARTADLLALTRRPDEPVRPDEPTLAFDEFAAADVPVLAATDDGSLGAAGLLPDVLADYLDRHADRMGSTAAYTCGPEPMMRAVARLCERHQIPTQVSLERMMACGMGTCQSCVVRLRDDQARDGWRYRLCCTDGPVFDAREVVWDG